MRRNTGLWRTAAIAVMSACGPSTTPDGMTGDGSTTGVDTGDGSTTATPTTGAPGSSTTDAPTSTGEPVPSTTDEETTTPALTTTTGDATTDAIGTTTVETTGDLDSTGDPDSTGGSGSTGDVDASITKAWIVQSLPLQVRIFQGDPETDLCEVILMDYLVEGGGTDQEEFMAVERPEGWGIRLIAVHQGFDLCFDPYEWYLNDPEFAETATGTITFHDVDQVGWPKSIDLDVNAVYDPTQPWLPAELDLDALAVIPEVG